MGSEQRECHVLVIRENEISLERMRDENVLKREDMNMRHAPFKMRRSEWGFKKKKVVTPAKSSRMM